MVTNHASTLASGGNAGYACKAARNVSDQASSASLGPSTARQTRRIVGPCVVTTESKGCLALTWGRRSRRRLCEVRCSAQPARRSRDALLQVEQELLAVQAARISRQPTVGADDPMTGNDD